MWEGSCPRWTVVGAQTPAHPASSAQSSVPAATTNGSCLVTHSVSARISATCPATIAGGLGLMQVIARPPLPGCSWPFSQCGEKVPLFCLLLLSSWASSLCHFFTCRLSVGPIVLFNLLLLPLVGSWFICVIWNYIKLYFRDILKVIYKQGL
jgi:hypothetical protein